MRATSLPEQRNRELAGKQSKFLFLLFFTASLVSFSQDNIQERLDTLVGNGDTAGAKTLLKSWLLANGGRNEFSALLDRYIMLESNTSELNRFLHQLLVAVEFDTNRSLVYARLAILQELSGELDSSQESYHMAGTLTKGEAGIPYFLESSRLLYEQGFLEKAYEELNHVLLSSEDPENLARARLLKAYIAMADGKLDESKELLLALYRDSSSQAIKPGVLLGLFQVYQNDRAVASSYLNLLRDEYPGSPEFSLAERLKGKENDVSFYITPQRYFNFYEHVDETPNDMPQNIIIQTGSFTVKENADYMVSDLLSAGFTSEVIPYKKGSDPVYYRVVIKGMSSLMEAQLILLKLKNNGFEGFLFFDQD